MTTVSIDLIDRIRNHNREGEILKRQLREECALLIARLIDRGLSMRGIAASIGRSPTFVSLLHREKVNSSLEVLERLHKLDSRP